MDSHHQCPKGALTPIVCTCKVYFPNCVCQCTILLASLYNPDIRVPAQYIAATVSLRKAFRSLQGTAGRKRLQLIEAAKCDEKKIDSKVAYMTGTKPSKPPTQEPARKLVIPAPVSPSASDSDFQVALAH